MPHGRRRAGGEARGGRGLGPVEVAMNEFKRLVVQEFPTAPRPQDGVQHSLWRDLWLPVTLDLRINTHREVERICAREIDDMLKDNANLD